MKEENEMAEGKMDMMPVKEAICSVGGENPCWFEDDI